MVMNRTTTSGSVGRRFGDPTSSDDLANQTHVNPACRRGRRGKDQAGWLTRRPSAFGRRGDRREAAAGVSAAACRQYRCARQHGGGRERDEAQVRQVLGRIEQAARGTQNMMPLFVEAVEAYATIGEICDVLRGVFGEQRDALVF